MTVYVDDARYKFGGMIMCHMVADSLRELHAMADKVGLSKSWYHRGHYNISLSKRRRAIKAGAVEITQREAVAIRNGEGTPKEPAHG